MKHPRARAKVSNRYGVKVSASTLTSTAGQRTSLKAGSPSPLRQSFKRDMLGRRFPRDPLVRVEEERALRLRRGAVEYRCRAEKFAEYFVFGGPFAREHWIDVHGIPRLL